jgi:small-conductance mechanosensitive channel
MIPLLFDYTSWGDYKQWLDEHAMRLIVIVVLLLFAHWFIRRVFSRVFSRAITRATASHIEDRAIIKRRAETFSATLNWALGILLFFVGSAIVLSEFGLNVSALIAAAGSVGVALGRGACLCATGRRGPSSSAGAPRSTWSTPGRPAR